MHLCAPAAPGPIRGCCSGSRCANNPRRAQLLVSRVLGKHVPTDPRVVHAAGLLLGGLVADALAARPPRALPVDLLHAAVRGAPGAAAALHAAAAARRSRRSRSTPSCSGSPRRPRRSATASRRPSAARTTCTPRGVRWRASPPRARSSRSTPTTPGTCSCRPTRASWPGRARWCWSTTSSPPAAPPSTRSRRCTAPPRAPTTCWPRWSTSARTRSPGCPTGCGWTSWR